MDEAKKYRIQNFIIVTFLTHFNRNLTTSLTTFPTTHDWAEPASQPASHLKLCCKLKYLSYKLFRKLYVQLLGNAKSRPNNLLPYSNYRREIIQHTFASYMAIKHRSKWLFSSTEQKNTYSRRDSNLNHKTVSTIGKYVISAQWWRRELWS